VVDLFYLIIGIGFVLSLLVRAWLRRTYAHWSRIQNSLQLPGASVARIVLDDNHLRDYHVTIQTGRLTDHYDPRTKTVSLSERIFNDPSVASAAIAAHETGHALQDKDGYGPMRFRAAALPMAQAGAQFGPWAAIGGSLIGSTTLIQLGFLMFAVSLLFHLLSLPIEFNASSRAKAELEQMGFDEEPDLEGARKVLFAAAMTYVAGAATAMGNLLLVLLFAGRSLFRKSGGTSR
jgi:Zn-dependent membrane protease YugP